ncbi:MAG: OmpA family protein [Bacteroidota bacterium]|nr:OmpA family protein [Bacteroidota bacterium]
MNIQKIINLLIVSILTIIMFLSINRSASAQAKLVNFPFSTEDIKITAPFVSYDRTKMLFIMQTDTAVGLMEANLSSDGSITEIIEIKPPAFKKEKQRVIGAASYNQNASRIYFSMVEKDDDHDLYYMDRTNETFENPVKLNMQINSGGHEIDPCISPDGRQLYFVRIPKGLTRDFFDCGIIFTSQMTESGWGKPLELPHPINTGCERTPRIAADGKTLFFASSRDRLTEKSDIFYTKNIKRGVWFNPVLADSVNSKDYELYPSITADGKHIFFSRESDKVFNNQKQLMYSAPSFNNRPEEMILITGKVTDKETLLSIDAKIEIQNPENSMVAYNLNTKKETGTYKVFLPKKNDYKIAISAPNYSTAYFYSKNYTKDDKGTIRINAELFSTAELILNVYDAEIAEPLEAKITITDTEKQEIINTVPEKITTGRYLITLPLGKSYRITTEKKYYGKNELNLDLSDIVQFDRFEKDTELKISQSIYEIQLTDAESGEGVSTTVEIKNLSTNETIIREVKTDEDGKLKLKLREGDEYEISVTPKGYAFYSVNISLTDRRSDNKTTVQLNPLKKETKIKLKRILFEFNSADLNAKSFDELDRVVKLLLNNPDIKIEISAHTDDVGSNKYNLKLSDRRAKSVVKYIIDQGISSELLLAKGYGELQPAFTPVEEEKNRKRNRRVEMKVLDTD